MLTCGALTLKDAASQRARELPANAKCKQCKSAEGELRACSFCPAVLHDTAVCLPAGDAECGLAHGLTHEAFLPVVLPQVLCQARARRHG